MDESDGDENREPLVIPLITYVEGKRKSGSKSDLLAKYVRHIEGIQKPLKCRGTMSDVHDAPSTHMDAYASVM